MLFTGHDKARSAMNYFLLFLAILAEVSATLLLKASNGWERWWFGIGSVFLYTLAGIFLGIVLKTMSVGIIYTIWSGAGVALVCVASVLLWQQKFDVYALSGIALIVAGTLLITAKSHVIAQ